MTIPRILIAIGIFVSAVVFLWFKLRRWLSPTERELNRARKGDPETALVNLIKRLNKQPSSPAIHGAIGQIHLREGRAEEAEFELRKALDLGSREASHWGALGWALVHQAKLGEALPIAEEANRRAHEDFEVYCLYCGLMAHHGRIQEVAPLFEFLERTSVQLERINSRAYEDGLREKYEFAKSNMNAAGPSRA
jgi:tetratricopeptide (TPR) repeat protein